MRFLATMSILVLMAPQLHGQAATWRLGRWNPDSFGNERAVLQVDAAANAVDAILPWRRRDTHAGTSRVIVTDSNNRRIADAVVIGSNADSARMVFAARNPGRYFVYYLPYAGSVRSNYPRITYPAQDSTADSAWARRARAADPDRPLARLVAFEAVDSLSQRWPMEVAANAVETALLSVARPGQAIKLFVEDRTRPIKMRDKLPAIWAGRADVIRLGPAARGEWFPFQVGVLGLRDVDSLRVHVAAGGNRRLLPDSAFSCINTDGIDWRGNSFHPVVQVRKGEVQPIWCGVNIPADLPAGDVALQLVVTGDHGAEARANAVMQVARTSVANHGDDEPWRLSRLRWLNSRLAATGAPTPPYTPVTGTSSAFNLLGRTVTLARTGLPAGISTRFNRAMTGYASRATQLLEAPFTLDVTPSVSPWRSTGVHIIRRDASSATFAAHSRSGPLSLDVTGELAFDGNLEYRVGLSSDRAVALDDVVLHIPLQGSVVRYFMGLNRPGGTAPDRYDWRWDVTHNQDAFWIGDVNAGIQVTLKDEHYRRPLNTNFYLQSPLIMPRSWDNGGRGSCSFRREGSVYHADCASGLRRLSANDTVWYNLRVLITPFHPIDTRTHFGTRYFHAYEPVDSVRATGANLVNVHHATGINPYLNYPFLRADAMRAYADSLHAAEMRLKIYYTVRELTNHAPEIWALHSLGNEVLADGPGGGHSWLQEHMIDHYLTGWVVPQLRDVALVTSGISRWHNYYVEGMRWLTQHAGVDGIYLDDVAFDRTTMLRIRRVLAAHGAAGERIDLHSANQFDRNDGFASSANLYLEHFPFIDRLWFGEGFNYDSPPDYWLIEMSGIPFGLMGEMLEGGGNPWRGMVFGMTNRLPWTGSDPRSLWHEWDAFGITRSSMHGWWTADAPVQTGRDDVLATTYQRAGHALVALASWSHDTVAVPLRINWRALGIDSSRARIRATAISGFQPARTFELGRPIPIAPGRGWLLRIDAFDPARPAR